MLLAAAPARRSPALPAVAADVVVQDAAVEPSTDEKTSRDLEDRSLALEAAPLMILAAAPAPIPPAQPSVRETGSERAEPAKSGLVTVTDTVEGAAWLRPSVLERHPGPDVQPDLPPMDEGGATLAPAPRLAPESMPGVAMKETPRAPAPAGTAAHLAATPAPEGDTGVARAAVTASQPNPAPDAYAAISAERPSATVAPVSEELRPSLIPRGGPKPSSPGRDLALAEASVADLTFSPTVVSSRRVPILVSRDEAGDAFSRAPRDRDGAAAVASSDATTAGAVGAASAPPEHPIAAGAHDRVRPDAPREVLEQITTPLRDVRSPGRHELSVRLDPPELGAVQIDARLDGGRLHLVIRAEQAVTGDLLTDALPRLRDALAQQGFTPGDVSVHLGFDASGRHLARDGAPPFRPSPDGELPRPPRVVPATARAVAVADGLDVWA